MFAQGFVLLVEVSWTGEGVSGYCICVVSILYYNVFPTGTNCFFGRSKPIFSGLVIMWMYVKDSL